jgi:hypothetical protein
MQDDVHSILIEEYEIDNLGVVECPEDKPVEEGLEFDCTAAIDGEKKKVPIEVTSDEGDYTVKRPEE